VTYLLDTHLLLRAASEPLRLSVTARHLLEDGSSELLFSPVSLWEIDAKRALGRADYQVDAALLWRGLVDNGYHELPLTSEHALAQSSLSEELKDPFDRLLLAQARAEGVTLLTNDPGLASWGTPVRRV
jgi:PIN domain nuclease of toxin-antitoxin system